MRPIAVEIDVDQDSRHVRSKVEEISDEGKNCAHLARAAASATARQTQPRSVRRRGPDPRAQLLDELGYDPDDGRPQLDELGFVPVGAVIAARDGARPVAVARLGSGTLVVVEDECPHDGGRISDGYVEGELLVCARHGWELVAPARAAASALAP